MGFYIWANNASECAPRYDAPAITDAYISLDGSTEVQHQHYTYSTTWDTSNPEHWDGKTTTVTTTDSVRGTSFQTVYTYLPTGTDVPPNTESLITEQVGNEKTITYYDTNGSLLKTVTKTWGFEQQNLTSEQTKLPNGTSSFTMFCDNSNAQVTEKDEYDFGTGTPSPPPSACSLPSGAGGGSLLRKTATSYASFSGNHIVNLPSSVITYNGSGTRVAETDSSYDQSSPQPTSVVQHTTAPGGSARGNLTTVIKVCFSGPCINGNSTTTYSYFDTGQVYQMIDPCGNATCSDMTGTSHTTTYGYADSYSGCGGTAPPSGASNAYLTQVTYPATGVSHNESYCYDYSSGVLRATTDENSQVTSYAYSDSLDRLTQVNNPDGGQTTVAYNDAPPTPSMTINKKLNSSSQYITNVTTMDGMGLPTENELTSDPAGTDYTITTYDGMGRPFSVTNPYHTTSDPTYGVTTYTYDALGRTTQAVHPDGTAVSTSYLNRATSVTDEGNGTRSVERISQRDGLGRLVSVCEVTNAGQQGGSGTPGNCGQDISATGFLTTYQYDTLDNLTSVGQNGLNSRSFSYDSLSRLTSASNPESGSTSYTYDANGNVYQRTNARSITTTYGYDSLDRLTSKSYSDGTTPSVSYAYDASSEGGQTLTHPVGRLVLESTDNGEAQSIFSYDAMGRTLNTWQCTPYNCGTGSFPLAYAYDYVGDVTSASNGLGATFSSTYNTAAQLTSMISSISDPNHLPTLLSTATYNPLGDVSSVGLGNGVSESLGYDTRGRLSSSAVNGGGTAGTGTVSISGSERSTLYFPPGCRQRSCAQTAYDYGTISITVDGFLASYGYGQGDTSTTVATALTSDLNGASSPVTATRSGTVITLISKATGSGSNYTLSSAAATQNTQYFTGSSFTGTPSGSTLTGGGSGGSVYTFSLGYAPNSDVTSVNDSVNGNWTYTYDDFNRISTSNVAGQAYTYAYDRYGNRWQQELNGSCTAGTAVCLTFDANNRINNGIETYDAAGNMLTDGFHNYTYDAENRIVCVDNGAAVYQYDAEGRRVRKITGASSCGATTGGLIVDYLYDVAGRPVTMWCAKCSWGSGWYEGDVWADGRHLATYSEGTLFFNHSDWQGTERARTGNNGASCETITSLPFGDGMSMSGSCVDTSAHHFTGKERDSESNLDNFGARYFGSSMGRFMSPDPLGGHLYDPQTLNKYVYVRDNPLRFTDPTGLDLKEQCSQESATCHKQHWWSRHRYVGTFDQHHHFDITHFQTDQNGNLAGHTVNFDSTGPHIDNNRAEFIAGTPATRVNGTDAFDGMHAVFNSNCGGTCAAGGLLFGTPAQFQNLFGRLVGPNPGLDAIDFFHPGTIQFRGGNVEGPDAHLSFTTARDPFRQGDPFHFDTRYPYGSIGGFLEHTGGVFQTFGNFLTGRHGPPLPDNIPATAVPQ